MPVKAVSILYTGTLHSELAPCGTSAVCAF